MKISTNAGNAVQLFERVSGGKNTDHQGGGGSNAYEQNRKDQEDSKEFEATVENIQKAVDDFSTNEMNVAHGISASSEGSGPGLKVLLKDSSGGVLRAVSGEEFMKLRQAIQAGAKSGRILDQKV